jgi:hypothetical protein
VDGIKAGPPASICWYNSHKPGGGIKYSALSEAMTPADQRSQMRLLQVGEKLVIIRLAVKPSDVEFCVQTPVENSSPVPYRACVLFQFQQKNYVQAANLKAIQDSIAEVFSLDTTSPAEGSVPPPGAQAQGQPTGGQPPPTPSGLAPAAPVPAIPLKLPATYVSSQFPADQLQLNADNTFSLLEASQSYSGTFAANGSALKLNISGGTETTATIQGNNLTDGSGQTWVLREQPAQAASGAAVLQNEDIIKMVKAGLDEAIILAKIGGSKCQFDTSTDALIQLKGSGVGTAVIKAMVGAGR